MEDSVEKRLSIRRRVLHQLRMGSEKELRQWYDDRVAGAGARLKATETRLVALHHRVTTETSDPFHISNSVDPADRAAAFSCEPFSPLHSLIHPPALPATPRPMEEDGGPPPLDQIKEEAPTAPALPPLVGEITVAEQPPAPEAPAQPTTAVTEDAAMPTPIPVLPPIADATPMVE